MRIPASKVYRAFPELDRFSDAQCEGFLAAARRGRARKIGRWFAQLFVLLLALVFGTATYLSLVKVTGLDPSANGVTGGADALFALALGVAFVLGAAAWLFTKDWLLRRRIRRVINTRGSCAACGYVTTGLPVGDDMLVTCPECGFRIQADPDLGEVMTDETGAKRFLPSPELVPAISRWLTARRKRIVARTLIIVPSAVLLLAGLAWGGYEWFLHRQARSARADREGLAGLRALLESRQPAGTDASSPDAWDPFLRAVELMARADIAVMREGPVEYPPDLRPDFSFLYMDVNYGDSPEDDAREAATRELTRAVMEEYRRRGLYELLDGMAACPRAVRPLGGIGADLPLSHMQLTELGSARHIARMNAARMAIAREVGDLVEFSSALETNLAITRMLERGLTIDYMVGAAVGALTDDRVMHTLAHEPDSAWLDAIEAAYRRHPRTMTHADALKSEKFLMLDLVSWLFSEPSRVRGGRFSSGVKDLTGSAEVPDKPLGTYRANRAMVAAVLDDMINGCQYEPFDRPATSAEPEPDLLLYDHSGGFWFRFRTHDLQVARDRALTTLLALARFRLEHGVYPESLDALVPRYLDRVPIDPWSGRPLCYRRAIEPDGPGFILYSTGADGEDNQGRFMPEETAALHSSGAGSDFPLGPHGLVETR